MKLTIKALAILFVAGSLYSCSGNKNTESTNTTSTDSANSDKTAAMDTTKTTGAGTLATAGTNVEQDFLNYAIPLNTKELIWIQAGINKGSLKDIKDHSKMMLKDHKDLAATIKNFMAKNTNYTMPTVDTTNTVTINDKTGADWDKAWSDKMLADHNELLDKLNTAKTTVKDAGLNKIVTNTIPVVQHHIEMTKSIEGKLK